MVNATKFPNLPALAALSPRTARQGQRGAAVFIVVMVLTLLTAVGLFAVRSASLADVAAGYDREGAQASFIAEYAITASAAYLAYDPSLVFLGYKASIDSPSPPLCQTNGPVVTFPPPAPRAGCYRLEIPELQSSYTRTTNESVFAPSNLAGPATNTSSLNPKETTNASFVVEVTDAAKTGVPAEGDDAKVSMVMMTLTAVSQVRPTSACAAPLSAPAAGQQVMRAMIATKSTLL